MKDVEWSTFYVPDDGDDDASLGGDDNENWLGEYDGDEAAMHVYPLEDLVEHELTDECVCGPLQNPVTRTDGSIGWVVVHHALDGRDNGGAAESLP